MNEEDIQSQMTRLLERLQQLEERVEILEKGGGSGRPVASSPSITGQAVGANVAAQVVGGGATNEALIEAIRVALGQIGEGEAGAVRQQLIKNGQPATISRSDVNKTLYNRKDLFTIDRQEGAKPIWKLLA